MPKSTTAPTLLGHTFKDGTTITATDLHQAKLELEAYLICMGLGHNLVQGGRVPFVRKSWILPKSPEVTPRWLEIMAFQQAYQIRPRFSRKEATPAQLYYLQTGATTTKVVAFEQGRQKVMNAMKPIAGRPDDWTLLGIEKEKELLKLVRVCYGAKAADDVSKCDLISYEMVLQLLARKNHYAVPDPAAGKHLKKAKPAKQKNVVPVGKPTVKKKTL